MTQPEYEHKKRECWKQFCKDNGLVDNVRVLAPTAFAYAFDRAYDLGRKEKDTYGSWWINIPAERLNEFKTVLQEHRAKRCLSEVQRKYYEGMENAMQFIIDRDYCLTDADKRELLTVSRELVQTYYQVNQYSQKKFVNQHKGFRARIFNSVLELLFDEKCLPDKTLKK